MMRSLSSSVLSTSKRNTERVIATSSFLAVGDWLVPATDLGRERRLLLREGAEWLDHAAFGLLTFPSCWTPSTKSDAGAHEP